MFFRLLLESFRRQRRRKLLAGVAILLGTTAVTAMLALATTIGDRIHQELAVYGANIIVTPKTDQLDVKIAGLDIKPATGGAYLHESDLAKLKTIFWANNLTGISPELETRLNIIQGSINNSPTSVRVLGTWFDQDSGGRQTGAPALHPSWRITGHWPPRLTHHEDFDGVVVGSALARKLNLHVGSSFVFKHESQIQMSTYPGASVTGIVSTGDDMDNAVLVNLDLAQRLAGLPDAISRVEISARTKPEDTFARRDPATLSPAQYEIWHCRPYANSIADDIEHAISNSRAQQLRRVEQTEGTVLTRISGLMWLISGAALLAAAFAVSAAMATAILERRAEIGLMRSLGASRAAIATLFYAETGILALLAGTLGYLLGSVLAATLGARIFSGSAPTASHILIPALFPVTVGTALLVALAGSTPSIRAALRLDPSTILRADA